MSISHASPWFDAVPDITRFPKITKTISADVAVIGGGIAGVMAAFYLSKAGKKVVLLEKNHIATGDTSAMASFISRAIDTPVAELTKNYGEDYVQAIGKSAYEMQNEIYDIIEKNNIDCDLVITNENYCSYRSKSTTLEQEWAFIQKEDQNADFVQSGKFFKEAIRFLQAGKFHIRKFIFGLLSNLGEKAQVFENTEVLSFDANDDGIILKTEEGSIFAKQIVVTTGKAPNFFPELENLVDCALSYAMVARYKNVPIPNTETFWDDNVPSYFYYRSIDKNNMIVGGCDIAPKNIHSQKPFEVLPQFLREHFQDNFEITHEWSGSQFITKNGLPLVFEHPFYKKKVYIATGFSGSGVIFGSLSAKMISSLVLGTATKNDELFSLEHAKITLQKPVLSSSQSHSIDGWEKVANIDDFSTCPVLHKNIGNTDIVLFKVENKIYALENLCSHAGGKLCDGDLVGKSISCPLHGARFDVQTGAVLEAPADRPQKTFETKIDANDIYVKIPSTEPIMKNPSAKIAFFALISSLLVDGNIPFAGFLNGALRVLAFSLPVLMYFVQDFRLFGSLTFFMLIIIALLRPMSDLFPEFRVLRTLLGMRRSFGIFTAMAALTHGLGFFYTHDSLSLTAFTKSQYWAWNGLYLYGIIGMLSSIPLLLTSNNISVRFFGKYWKMIQKLMYVMFYAACLHVAFMGRSFDVSPLILGLAVLIVRILAGREIQFHILQFLPFLQAANTQASSVLNSEISEEVWQCNTCGYTYDENIGDPDGNIPAGTSFEDIPASWRCPICGVSKDQFTKIIRKKNISTTPISTTNPPDAEKYEPELVALQQKMETGISDNTTPLRPIRFQQLLDNIYFLPAQLTTRPLDEREVEVNLQTIIGPHAEQPLQLELPYFVSHMSFGALSKEAKIALSKGAAMSGTASCSGEGGALPEELEANAERYIFEYASGRFGVNEDVMKKAAAIEIKIGQAAKAGMGGHLPGAKVTEEIATIRGVKAGETVISPAAHSDIFTKEDLKKKVTELRRISGGKPIGVKIAASHIEEDIAFALAAEVDFITVDCRGGATGAAPAHIKENICIPAPYAITRARAALNEAKASHVSLIITGGFRTSADIAKALALGADAVGLSTIAMIGIGCKQFRVCHKGTCPMGIATQSAELRERFNIEKSAQTLSNLFHAYKEELSDFARIVGKNNIHQLDVQDLSTTDSEISEYTPVQHA